MTNTLTEALEPARVQSHLHPTPSFDPAEHPRPNSHEEVWRFTPLRRFDALLEPAGPRTVTITCSAPEGVSSGELSRGEGVRGSALVPIDLPSALAEVGSSRGPHLSIPADARPAEPIEITLTGSGMGAPDDLHLVIEAGARSTATVILTHLGSAILRENVEIVVGDGAQLTVVSVQDWAADALHAGLHAARIGRDATLKHINATLGGDLVRLHTNVEYDGPGGAVELFGVYFTDAGQHQEHRLFVDHNAPATRSLVDYRGALQGQRAHAVWIGDVLIRSLAEGIDSYESNKNLLLTEGCRADSVPNLEIETGEIQGAGHSSSTGRFDEEQLFYLMSRGIPETEARRLVVQGFFFDIIRRIGVPAVEQHLMATVNTELTALSWQGEVDEAALPVPSLTDLQHELEEN